MMWGSTGGDGSWLAMGIGMLVWVVLMVLVVWVVVRALIGLDRTAGRGRAVADPEQILRERFARGEVTDEEYRSRLATLRGT